MRRYIPKKMILVFTIVFLLLGCFLQLANASDLEKVKKAIKEKKAKWEAGETSISKLPEYEIKLRLGAILDDEIVLGGKPVKPDNSANSNGSKLPRELDWRDKDRQCWVTPVKDQKGCGGCWAFGSIAQLESVKMIAEGTPDPDLDLSEQYIVSCYNNHGCSGAYLYTAYDFLRDTGVPDEECYKYLAKDADTGAPCEDACLQPALVNIDNWSKLAPDVDALKAAVYENPVTVAFYVYEDFLYYKSGVYKHVTGNLLGGHAVCIVGWNHRQHCFIVKNSWGPGWGESGYFNIAYSEVTNEVYFGLQAGKFNMSAPTLAPPRESRPGTLVTVWGKIKNTH
jgi:C1A family cysteine protease